MRDHKHSRKLIEDLINSFLMEEIIPDILIDILSGKKYLVSIYLCVILHTCTMDVISVVTSC